jgi:hypothetical protein
MAAAARGLVPSFYRIVLTDPPTLYDFQSNKERGRALPTDLDERRLWEGLSVYATESQARRKARGMPALGGFIAAVDLPERGPIRYERTLRSSGHHTVWGDAALLLSRVVSVVPVESRHE